MTLEVVVIFVRSSFAKLNEALELVQLILIKSPCHTFLHNIKLATFTKRFCGGEVEEGVGNAMFAIKTKLITSLGTTKKIFTHHQTYLQEIIMSCIAN
jgi:hypothetical protein